jgi:cytosine/adenosine deaminase-related metal-dependent hydrolase
MTRDDIIRLAREAGAEVTDFIDCHFPEEMFLFDQTQLKQFIALIDKEMALNPESIVSADEAQLDRIAKMLGEKP